MSDLQKMADEELNMHINNLQRALNAPDGAQPWGIPTQRREAVGRLERLRAEQVRRTSVIVDRPERLPLPRVRAEAVKMGGLAVDRAKAALEEALFVLVQGNAIGTGPLQDALGLVSTVHGQLADLGAPIEGERGTRPRYGKDGYGRKVRYLSHKEHDLLTLANAERGCLVLAEPASRARGILVEHGMVRCIAQWPHDDHRASTDPIPYGKMRCLITPKGRRAMETWHYEVE